MGQTPVRMVKNLATFNSHYVFQSDTAGSPSLSAPRAGIQDTALPHALAPSRPLQLDSDGLEDFPTQKLSDQNDISDWLPISTSTRGLATNRSPLKIRQTPISGRRGNLHDHEDPPNSHHMAMRGNSIDERPSISTRHINDQSHPCTSSEARTKLLAKLEQEKYHARCADTREIVSKLGHDRILRTVDTDGRSLVSSGHAMQTRTEDSRLIEAKLRTRTQLQVRLAAEKRSCGV